ncbi:hypothetical protein [Neisseria animaloris]|uniref:hypothetical protein n=1 Tax=Neisseria animaloris TaxID=326522 RepID=UPI000F82FCD0|nr:hypothetical protein [Neisseria animaloris]
MNLPTGTESKCSRMQKQRPSERFVGKFSDGLRRAGILVRRWALSGGRGGQGCPPYGWGLLGWSETVRFEAGRMHHLNLPTGRESKYSRMQKQRPSENLSASFQTAFPIFPQTLPIYPHGASA